MYWLLILSGFLFAGPLQVTEPVVSQFEDGPALPTGQKLVPGETIFFRFEAANFRTSESGKVQLTGHAQVFDPRGTPVAPPDEVAIATSLREEDKDWKPRFRSQFQLPAIAPPGTYRIRFDALDMQTRQKASGESSFEVEGADVPPSQQLIIRKIAFYRGQDDEAPLKIAAYRPGEAVWVRFDITGYKYAPQNAIDVTYDVAVSNAAGKQLFAQENAAVERSQAFYPQPWVPGIFSLSLQPNTAPGTYAITVTARDAVGKQTVAERAEFRVE
ncbi:MAG TPA: hypothetical protein VHB50_23970 [Bryobacteraceae bacterium]|nr:hypothetical protein [Bryobacteraceae bacterium]